MNLYLVDLDGTISKKDSMFKFFSFIHKRSSLTLNFLKSFPYFCLYFLNFINAGKAKSEILRIFFDKFSEAELNILAEDFANYFMKDIKNSAIDYLEKVSSEADNEVYLVTASLDIWAQPISKALNTKLIATKSAFKNRKFYGIDGENCTGPEKIRRIKEILNLQDFDKIYAFGNSKGDKEMLSIADHKFFKFFN